jgi:enamine deaminase RidA (YjgF/YER057c/UK114 family)
MERTMTTPHRIVNPESLAAPVGFSHAVSAAPGRTVHVGGQAGHDGTGELVGHSVVEQFDRSAANVVEALVAAGARPEHLVSLHIYVTDVPEYRSSLTQLATIYRRHFGRHYPAVALFGASELFDPAAKVELVAVAVVPE